MLLDAKSRMCRHSFHSNHDNTLRAFTVKVSPCFPVPVHNTKAGVPQVLQFHSCGQAFCSLPVSLPLVWNILAASETGTEATTIRATETAAAVVAARGGAAEAAFRADTLTMAPAGIRADMPAMRPAHMMMRLAATASEAVVVAGGGAGGAAFRAARTMLATQ